MACIIVHSKKKDNVVGKLLYQIRGPYIILDRLSLGTYNCRKYGKPTSAIKNIRTEDLYLLPPSIFPTESVDTSNLRYLISDSDPLHHHFAKDFNIGAYNTLWFNKEPPLKPKRSPLQPLLLE